MIRFLLLAILVLIAARVFWVVMDGILEAMGGKGPKRQTPVKLVRDPVCGTYVAPASAVSLTAGGETLYFCSEECRSKYRAA